MSTARSGFGSFTLGGCIYVAGGYDEQDAIINVVEKYDPLSDTWITVSPMLSTRGGVAAQAVQIEVNLFDALIAKAQKAD